MLTLPKEKYQQWKGRIKQLLRSPNPPHKVKSILKYEGKTHVSRSPTPCQSFPQDQIAIIGK